MAEKQYFGRMPSQLKSLLVLQLIVCVVKTSPQMMQPLRTREQSYQSALPEPQCIEPVPDCHASSWRYLAGQSQFVMVDRRGGNVIFTLARSLTDTMQNCIGHSQRRNTIPIRC